MFLLLDTSTPVCKLTLIDDGKSYTDSWQADRTLAQNLLKYLEEQLRMNGADWDAVSGIGVMKGPGSFTGLRIGMTVLNTIADTKSVLIVGEMGDDWQEKAVRRLKNGENEQIVLPVYGREANITKPRK